MVNALIFDMDGTLVDLTFRSQDAKVEIFALLGKMGFDTTKLRTDYYTLSILDEVQRQAMNDHVPTSFTDAKAVVYDILDRFELEGLKVAGLKKGTIPTLEHLSRQYKMALVTNSGEEAVKYVFGKFSIERFFSSVVNRDRVDRIKPDSEGIRLALRQLGVKPNEALLVGDSYLDAIAAVDAGVRVAVIMSQNRARDKVFHVSPDFLISSITDLRELFLNADGLKD